MYILELTNVCMHGLAAAAFALMYALGGSAMALLGALHPLWRWNMIAMAGVALLTMLAIAITIPESPTWLARKGKNLELEVAMRKIMGDTEYIQELRKMKFAYKKKMEQANSERQVGKTWSAPLGTILADVLKQKRKIPKPPFSVVFLVILYICIGWSGLTYVTLNGPKLFEVGHRSILKATFITPLHYRLKHKIWALTNIT